MTVPVQIFNCAQQAVIFVASLFRLLFPLRTSTNVFGTTACSAVSTKTSRRFSARSMRIGTTAFKTCLLFCICVMATAQAENPACSKNVCVVPPNKCVETCPRNERGVYFKFGLRSNKKCTVSKPGMAANVDVNVNDGKMTTDFPSMESPQLQGDISDPIKGMGERQELWPEFGPPECIWGMCQFSGPPCILSCTDSHVYYGDNGACKDKGAVQGNASRKQSPSKVAVLTTVALVILSVIGSSQAMFGIMSIC